MIFCVEDDDKIRNLIIYTLNASDFEARGFGNGQELFEALEEEKPQLIILDIMLPGKDGIEILKELRGSSTMCGVPVIMASAKGTEYDKIMGLDLGADDYLAKPFGMMEMVSRVKAVLRRTEVEKKKLVLQLGNLVLNREEHTVFENGKPVELTLKEFKMLEFLLENAGMVFTRNQLLARIWGDEYIGESRTVDVHIGTLRTKLGDCGSYIVTVRGVGYKMEVKP